MKTEILHIQFSRILYRFSESSFFQNHSETTLFFLKETCEQNETI